MFPQEVELIFTLLQSKKTDGAWESDGRLRTFRNIQENVDAWQASGGKKKNAKDFTNCVEKPLLAGSDDDPGTLMLLKAVPPALHLKLSINHFLQQLAKVWPEVLVWLDGLNIFLEPYHGGQTQEGNEASKVLKNLHSLEEILPAIYSPFLDCLVGLRDTIDSTFGFTLDPNYQEVIDRFKKSFDNLRSMFGVSVTTKLHIIFTHVSQFIELTGKPLGEFSEQELENSHSAFESLWNRYRVKKTNCEMYSVNYLRAVLNFNALNI